jgi:hypothetical protein
MTDDRVVVVGPAIVRTFVGEGIRQEADLRALA